MVLNRFSQLKDRLNTCETKPAVVAAAHDRHTLEGVLLAQRDGLIRPILVGQRQKIMEIAEEIGLPITQTDVVDADTPEQCAEKSVALIRAGDGELLIKGMMQTATLLRAVLNRDGGIRRGDLLSHVAVLEVPPYHKLLFITDGGMVVAPDLKQKRGILSNALPFCRSLGYEMPKVAVLCAAETESDAMPETIDAAALKREWNAGTLSGCVVEGPISFDLATDSESAAVKGYQSPVAGDADILLMPSIAAGNILAKGLYGLAGGAMAGVVLGASVPITVNSRGATAQEKYDSILLCAAAQAGKE